MSVFWSALAAYLAGMVAVLIVLALMSPLLYQWLLNFFLKIPVNILAKDKYTENWFEMFTTGQKINARILMETMMRAKQGKSPDRPFGSVLIHSPWEKLMLNPTYLVRVPPSYKETIDTSVVIGPQAKKPLKISIPVLVAGMSFGHAVSAQVKTALARASALADTAMNTGEGFIEEERRESKYLIMQHTRGIWSNATQFRPELYKNADAIEIQIGQGAQAAVPQVTKAKDIDEKMREVYGIEPGSDTWIDGHFRDVTTPEDLKKLVKQLKEQFGVPVGYKFGATQHLEAELKAAVDAEVDFITIDGAEGGTHAASATIADDVGLPEFHALVRTVDYLKKRGVRDKISVLASGGLRTPGEYAKAIALGADAVYIGTIAIMALLSEQAFKSALDEPPTQVALNTGKYKERFDIEAGVQNLYRYFKATRQELIEVLQALGKRSITELDRSDLVSLDKEIARFAGIAYAGEPASDDLLPTGTDHRRAAIPTEAIEQLEVKPLPATQIDSRPNGHPNGNATPVSGKKSNGKVSDSDSELITTTARGDKNK